MLPELRPKIVQVAVAYAADTENLAVYALDTDGRLWQLCNAGDSDEYWIRVADLPMRE